MALTFIPVAGFVWGIVDPKDFEAVKSLWRQRADDWGVWAPVMFVLAQVAQVVVTPLSHYTVGLVGGFLFGTTYGAILNWTGRVIGHTLAFFIAKKLGRVIVKKFVPEESFKKFEYFFSEKSGGKLQASILFLIFFLPLLPDDELSYIAGIAGLKTKYFMLANIFGQTGGALSLAYLGSGASTNDPMFWILTAVTLAGFPVMMYLFGKTKNA